MFITRFIIDKKPTLNKFLKYGLHADNMTLWAFTFFPSHIKVTSTKSWQVCKFPNADKILF